MYQIGQNIFIFLQHYGYWMLLPMMIIEGPITTVIAAMLSSLGMFNIGIVFAFSLAGDLIGDITFYVLGYKFGMGFVKHLGKYIGVNEKLVLRVKKYFSLHGGKTIFVVKTTVGLCWVTFITAGIVKMNFKKFLKYSFYGGLVWSSFLVALGYFYGYLWRRIGEYIEWIGWLVFALALISILAINAYKKYKTKQMLGKIK